MYIDSGLCGRGCQHRVSRQLDHEGEFNSVGCGGSTVFRLERKALKRTQRTSASLILDKYNVFLTRPQTARM